MLIVPNENHRVIRNSIGLLDVSETAPSSISSVSPNQARLPFIEENIGGKQCPSNRAVEQKAGESRRLSGVGCEEGCLFHSRLGRSG